MPSIVYTVREGDTLWNIAKAYGTTVNDIARYNGIVETDVIYPGQRLRIFVPEESTPKWYVVRPGDTLTKIAEKFGTTSATLDVAQRYFRPESDLSEAEAADPSVSAFTAARHRKIPAP